MTVLALSFPRHVLLLDKGAPCEAPSSIALFARSSLSHRLRLCISEQPLISPLLQHRQLAAPRLTSSFGLAAKMTDMQVDGESVSAALGLSQRALIVRSAHTSFLQDPLLIALDQWVAHYKEGGAKVPRAVTNYVEAYNQFFDRELLSRRIHHTPACPLLLSFHHYDHRSKELTTSLQVRSTVTPDMRRRSPSSNSVKCSGNSFITSLVRKIQRPSPFLI